MNYFDFFGIPVSFNLDAKRLRSLFLEKSKELHPDFHTLADEQAREQAEQLSSLNNQAYQTLSDTDARIRYVLELKNALGEEGSHKMSPDFLVHVMDINEALMELEFDEDPGKYASARSSVQQLERELNNAVQPELDAYDKGIEMEQALLRIRDYYFKKRYLLRIKENLTKFAPA